MLVSKEDYFYEGVFVIFDEPNTSKEEFSVLKKLLENDYVTLERKQRAKLL